MNNRTAGGSSGDASPAAPKKPSSDMVYLCACSKRWTPPRDSRVSGPKVWTCSCGRTLAVRNGVIHAPEKDYASWVSRGNNGHE